MVADPGLSLASALTHLAAGELAAAQRDLRHAQQSWPVHGAGEHAEVPARGGERPHLSVMIRCMAIGLGLMSSLSP
jgi:hypothetical protein